MATFPTRLRTVGLAVVSAALLAGAVACGVPESAPAVDAVQTDPQSTATPPAVAASPSATEESDAAAAAERSQVVRVVGVVDGDTLRVSVDGSTERLRIIGIDAPELKYAECYAQEAASKMQSLVQSKDVRIEADPTQEDRDRYGRLLRHVWTLDEVNVARELVAAGLAKEYTYDRAYAGQAEYRAAEDSARAARLGLWGACNDPGAGSAGIQTAASPTDSEPVQPVPLVPQPQPPSSPAPPVSDPGECNIKGNISTRTGERIYHVPGQRYYDETEIDLGKGERWFCSEQEAIDAGWRKAKV